MSLVQRLNGNDGWWLEWESGSEGKPGRIACYNDEGVRQWGISGEVSLRQVEKAKREFLAEHIAGQLALFDVVKELMKGGESERDECSDLGHYRGGIARYGDHPICAAYLGGLSRGLARVSAVVLEVRRYGQEFEIAHCVFEYADRGR